MLKIRREQDFLKILAKIKDNSIKEKIKKIIQNPEMRKPMRYGRKGTRELFIPPYRISYSFDKKSNVLIFLDLYHKDEQ